jgi:uncharacterized membrane protein
MYIQPLGTKDMNDQLTTPPPVPVRSRFVTVVAWVFIVLAGTLFLYNGFMTVAVAFLAFSDQAREHMKEIALAFTGSLAKTLFWAIVMTCAAGLRKRKYWARLLFTVALSVGIAATIGKMVVQLNSLSELSVPEAQAEAMEQMVKGLKMTIIGFSVVVTMAYGWLIYKFNSEKIKAEFTEAE